MSARMVAVTLIERVLRQHQLLEDLVVEADLEVRDRQFALLLVRAVLRWRGWFDVVLAEYLERPLPEHAWRVQDVLHLGLAQLLLLETPPHAAVDEAVTLARETGFAKFSGLINAVLRKVAADGERWRAAIREPGTALAALPAWIGASWRETYGEATAAAMAYASLQPASLDLSVKEDVEGWAERLDGEELATGTVRLSHHGAIEGLPGFAEGAWWVQDAAAALPARLFGEVRDEVVVDLCAAPGGKTAQLCALGARVIAVDRSAKRMARLSDNMRRLGFVPETVVADALQWRPAAPVRAVLLDAPCSSTGTLRRHPDLMWHKTPRDVAQLAAVQAALLAHAWEMLAPGGVLVYATCSLQPEEGEQRIAAFLDDHPDAARLPILAGELGGEARFLAAHGEVRVLPHHWPGGIDGFFMARLVRSC